MVALSLQLSVLFKVSSYKKMVLKATGAKFNVLYLQLVIRWRRKKGGDISKEKTSSNIKLLFSYLNPSKDFLLSSK